MDENSTPTFERVLSAFESAPADTPFDPAHIAVLTQLQRASKAHYAKMLDAALQQAEGADALPVAVMRGAQMLHRRMAGAFAQAALRLIPHPHAAEERARIAELALCSLRACADEIKWHAFEQTTPPGSSWQQANALLLAIEALGIERRGLADGSNCTDAFAHCLLLSSLNVGILSAPQMELAQRWLSASARDMRVEPFFDPEAHWYQIDLARPLGPERVAPSSAVADTTRFLAVAALGPRLGQARTRLYAGELPAGITFHRIAALHFGAFLDLAERLWSQDWRRVSWRSERDKAEGESIEVVLGYSSVIGTLGDGDDERAPARSLWPLRDKSTTGLGAVVSKEAGAQIALGELVAFRASGDERWQLGCIVRRIRAPDANQWTIGIKRLSASPVAIDLESCSQTLQLETETADVEAIYAPINTDTGRIDGLVLDADGFGSNSEYFLPTNGGAFRIRANRVIDRGERWVRVGFEVLGKK